MDFGSAYVLAAKRDEIEIVELEEEKPIVPSISYNGDSDQVMLEILDTAGTEQFTAMRDLYMKNGDIFMLIYSVIATSTFNDMQQEMLLLTSYATDLEDQRVITREQGEALAEKWGVPFFETSAKTRVNVNEAFFELVRQSGRRQRDYKMVMMGDGGVGKSSLTVQFVQGIFVEKYDPTIEDTYRKQAEIPGLPKSPPKHNPGMLNKLKFWSKSSSKEEDKKEKKKNKKPAKTIECPKEDTNVVALSLGTLADKTKLMTGEAVFCSKCGVAFSSLSSLDSDDCWHCEFCGEKNDSIHLEEEEVPSADCVDYIIEPPKVTKDNSEGIVVLCVDTSGSMCVSTELPKSMAEWKKVQDKGRTSAFDEKKKEILDIGIEGVNAVNQFLPGEKHDAMYISRLECLKAAVDWHISRLLVQYPKKKLILMTFNSSVTVLGDGSGVPEVITGDKLSNLDVLLECGSKLPLDQFKPIKDSHSTVRKALQNVQESGATALGPALAIAIGFASQQKGSEIILCTDGASNVGVGALDNAELSEKKKKEFYDQMGLLAKKNETTVSVIGIEGVDDGVALKTIGSVADLTGGTCNILHALELMTQIVKISQNPIIATEVQITLLSHPELQWISEVSSSSKKEKNDSVLKSDIGNATAESDVTFQFAVRDVKKKLPQKVPFQAQIRYKRTDGYRCIRIITKELPVTLDREKAEEVCDVAIVGLNGVQQVAKIALQKDKEEEPEFEKASQKLQSVQRLLSRCAKTNVQKEELSIFGSESSDLATHLRAKQKKEKGNDDVTAKVFFNKKGARKNEFLSGVRKRLDKRLNCDDKLAQMFYDYKFNKDKNLVK